ncbi:hypothetical protein AX777_24840 [Sphingobium yanoikuyae]|uniref:Uncharacterized protein n=1 Tax=Sphingobium yanoikuyae TaxID=13690 RepID=A0A177IYB9_SPHYA|nr:hypothetical protein AX777_24840 [Sphingobium yanoikuyae]
MGKLTIHIRRAIIRYITIQIRLRIEIIAQDYMLPIVCWRAEPMRPWNFSTNEWSGAKLKDFGLVLFALFFSNEMRNIIQ